jgi:dTDP-4-dehydrorhamnose reductase
MQKILHTGGTGFFSLTWSLDTEEKFKNFLIVNTKRNNLLKNSFLFSLRSKKKLNSFIKKINPDYIFHTAALTDVDMCQKKFFLSKKINFNLTKTICNLCKKNGIKLVFISTDQIFNTKNKRIKETEVANPVNTYSLHKFQSENYILNNLKNYLIIRTNFFGYAPIFRKSFLNFVKLSLEGKKKVYLYKNIKHTPISLHFLNKCILKLLLKNFVGIINISSNEIVSKYSFGLMIAKIFKLNNKYIFRTIFQKNNNIAARPLNMSLSNSKLKKVLRIKIPSINTQLREIFNNLKKNYYKKILRIK